MFYRVEIENFFSIRHRQVLDLRVPASVPQGTTRLVPCGLGSDERAPKVVVVFGPNGSGKSTLLRALSFVCWFIHGSFALPQGVRLPHQPFNSRVSAAAPTRLAIQFSGPDLSETGGQQTSAECPYRYEVVLGNWESAQVLRETIVYWPRATGRKTRLVERDGNGRTKAGRAFGIAGYMNPLGKILRDNASIISTLAELRHPLALMIRDAARAVNTTVSLDGTDIGPSDVTRAYVEHPELIGALNRVIAAVGVGVRSVEVQDTGEGPQLVFRHEGLRQPVSCAFEGRGARRLARLFPLIHDTLRNGNVAFIDGLDFSMHPKMLAYIVDWFRDPRRNPRLVQLWMTCHNATLLETLSKDEIVLCDRNLFGESTIFCLNGVKSVRRDDNYYKKYLAGVYGGIPRVG